MKAYNAKRALLGSIIDYAGTFPPAALSFEAALQEAASRQSQLIFPWLYAKMALPMELLKSLSPQLLVDSGADGTPWLFTALGTAMETNANAGDFVRTVEWDLRELARVNERGFYSSCRYLVSNYETKIPESALTQAKTVSELLRTVLDRMQAVAPHISPLFELPLGADWRRRIVETAEGLATWFTENDKASTPGIKIRTGGQLPPSSEQLAAVFSACITHGLRFKATQGLHHAITRTGDFGFVNVFAALTLAQSLGEEAFPESEIQNCLNDTHTHHFKFTEQHFSWNQHQLDLDAIESARRRHAGSFGSCSLKEPDDFLNTEFKGV